MTVSESRSCWEGRLMGWLSGMPWAPLELHRRERITPITGMIEGGKFRMRRVE